MKKCMETEFWDPPGEPWGTKNRKKIEKMTFKMLANNSIFPRSVPSPNFVDVGSKMVPKIDENWNKIGAERVNAEVEQNDQKLVPRNLQENTIIVKK